MTTPNDFYKETEEELKHCAAKYHPSTFRMWPPNCRVPFYEVHLYDGYLSHAVQESSRRLKAGPEAYAEWCGAMNHSAWGYYKNDRLFFDHFIKVKTTVGEVRTSTYNLKANHHYSSYERLTGRYINSFERIVEWGAGVGDLAKFILKMGYKGEYTIVDLPGTTLSSQANFAEWPRSYRPIFTSEPPAHDGRKTLFISTWAFSETPMELRDPALEIIKPDNWLIVAQRNLVEWGYNNEEYFKDWKGRREEIPWIAWDDGSFILVK
jgi:hypothetical protein